MIAPPCRPARASRTSTLASWAVVLALASLAGCDEVPLTAPTESSVVVFVGATIIPAGGSTEVTASVTEKAGTAVQNGTLVTFTSTLGTFDPVEARTHNGKATVKFLAGSVSGTAKIGAFSGGAKATEVEVKIGGAAAKTVSVSASPATLPSTGGTSQILAIVTDESGNRLASTPVSFSTTAGTLSAASVSTDGNGEARVQLTATRAADVTATAGSASGKVSVTLNAPLGITITSPGSLQAETPASFTIAVTAASGSVVRDVVVDWGDGTRTSLGALTGSTSVSHSFLLAGNYSVSVSATDTNGESTRSSTSVTVVPVQVSITITGPLTVVVNTPVTYTISVTPTTLQVKSYTLTIDGALAGGGTETATTVSYEVKFPLPVGQKTLKVSVATVPGNTYTKELSVTANPTP